DQDEAAEVLGDRLCVLHGISDRALSGLVRGGGGVCGQHVPIVPGQAGYASTAASSASTRGVTRRPSAIGPAPPWRSCGATRIRRSIAAASRWTCRSRSWP